MLRAVSGLLSGDVSMWCNRTRLTPRRRSRLATRAASCGSGKLAPKARLTPKKRTEVDTPPGAFTWDGDLYAQAPGRQLVKLDKKTGTWNAQPTLSEGILLGARENELVFWRRGESALRYVALKDRKS